MEVSQEQGTTLPPKPLTKQNEIATRTLDKIRPELNLEKWPIWQPAKSKNRPVERIIEREITLAGGNKLSARVEIGFTNRGDLTTEDQRTYYALIKQWEDNGRPEQYTYFSLRHLAKRLRKRWGTNVITSLTESLIRLRTTPFIWKNSYYDGATKETIRVLDTFNILSDLRIIRREQDGVVNKEVGYFKFNDFTLKNLLANHTKPVLFDTVLNFHSEIAQMLYTYLDLILADKNQYERRSIELFSDLGLRGKAYRNASNRKQLLDRALRELQSVPISTGMITEALLEDTKDGKDFKIVIKKGRRALKSEMAEHEQLPQTPDDAKKVSASVIDSTPSIETEGQAREIVRYFYATFHPDVRKVFFTSKATDQAVSLIAHVGYDRARFIIEFSYRVAPATGYQPQTFGGILQYASRAMAEYDQAQVVKQDRDLAQSCSFCSGSGFRRIGPNTMRRCTHDTRIETELSPDAQNSTESDDSTLNAEIPT